jgi:Icc-related predicted phosphoesterase
MRYSRKEHQYTDTEMDRRLKKMRFALHRAKGVDILLTHAPAKGIGDGQDLCHQGFRAFLPFMEKYQPRFMVHGHVHMNYGVGIPRLRRYGETTIINAYERYILEI